MDIKQLADQANIAYLKWRELFLAEQPLDPLERARLRIEQANAASVMHKAERELDEAVRASEPLHDGFCCSGEGT